MLESLESWATQTCWPFVQDATLASLLVFLVVACVWFAIRRRASAHLGYALFLLPLVPFVVPLRGLLPLSVDSDAPLARWLPSSASDAPLVSTGRLASRPVDFSPAAPGDGTARNTGQPAAFDADAARLSTTASLETRSAHADPGRSEGPPWALMALASWSSIAALLALRWIFRQFRTQRLVRSARPLRDPRTRLIVRRTLERAGLQRRLRVAECPGLHAPAVSGLWYSTLLLPTNIAERLDDDTLTWSLHHELAHLTRHDLWAASFQRALEVLWWFHPVVWLTSRVVGELRECACDEAALAQMPGLPRRNAALALVDLVEAARGPDAGELALASLHSQKNTLEKRIMRLIDPRRSCRPGLTPAASSLLALVASAAFATTQLSASPMQLPVEQQEPPEEPQEIEEQEPLEEPIEEVFEEPSADELARAAVARSLDWIARAQDYNGSWTTGHPDVPMAGEFNDVGITALAIECLLASEDIEHRDAARRGLEWLGGVQDPELGLFGKRESWGYNSGHALATRLWIRLHRERLEGPALEVAQRAVEYIQRARNPYSGWRFEYPPIGDNDTFVTSLMLRALSEAKRAGLAVDEQALQGGLMFLDEVTDPSNGRTGYVTRGGEPGRLADKRDDFPVEYSEYPTAMAILARMDLGADPIESHVIIAGSGLIARTSPRWDPVRGTNDGYYWLYGTEVLHQLGGVGWMRWRRDLIEALVSSQRADGSWPLMDAWSGKTDRAHMACVYTLALQGALRD